jgi:hypothetical protein
VEKDANPQKRKLAPLYLFFIFLSKRFLGSFGFFVLSTSTAKQFQPVL